MKKSFLLYSRNLFSYLMVFSVFASMSSCSNSYTASFQKVPGKNYTQEQKAQIDIESKESASAKSNFSEGQEIISDVPQEAALLKIPEDLSVSLKEMGILDKRSEKIQKRLEKLNESLENASTESIDTRKLSFSERLVVRKSLKKAEKILAENDVKNIKDLDDAQKLEQMNRNVRIGLILILVGIVAGIFIWPIGAIVGTIGVVFLILGLLDY
ncbi:hypothetical protein BH23BAC1_BH23BAC1_34570 [soil metagenome]